MGKIKNITRISTDNFVIDNVSTIETTDTIVEPRVVKVNSFETTANITDLTKGTIYDYNSATASGIYHFMIGASKDNISNVQVYVYQQTGATASGLGLDSSTGYVRIGSLKPGEATNFGLWIEGVAAANSVIKIHNSNPTASCEAEIAVYK